jgi:hypothetical protein
MQQTVIIIAETNDIHAQGVQYEVQTHLGFPCFIIDSAAFPSSLGLDIRLDGRLSTRFLRDAVPPILHTDILGCWRRRVRNQAVSPDLTDESARELSGRDSRSVLGGFLLCLASTACNVVNDPRRETPGLNKAYQLTCAQSLGMPIPQTLMTNNPKSVMEFCDHLKGSGSSMVYKGINSPREAIVTTKLFQPRDLERLSGLEFGPAIFQEYIKGRNLRVTVVGKHVFPAEVIVSVPEAELDWRIEGCNKVVPYKMEAVYCDTILQLMSKLGLTYGALDFKIHDDGRIVFLEVNPGGQFLFVEVQTGQPICRAIAETLVRGT